MKAPLIVALCFLMLCGSSGAEIYKWIDDKETVHFTEDPSTIPEKYRDKAKGRLTDEDMMTPEERAKTKKQQENTVRDRQKEENYQKSLKEEKEARAKDYYCREANRLKKNIARAQASYYAYSKSEYVSLSLLQSYCNDIVFARKEFEDLEETARINGIPPGWLDCR